jgi:acyl transferase domain-containing protein
MVTADIAQLSQECSTWLASLRTKRDEFSQFKKNLQELITHPLPKDELPQVEHLHNQFEIQLTNINHLKHSIKEHDKRALWEKSLNDGNLSDGNWAIHESLHDQVQSLEHTLEELRDEFSRFMQKVG